MLRFLTDENFSNSILRGLYQRVPELDVVRVQDVGLRTSDDLIILEWAAKEERLLLTHDVKTITAFTYERIRQGKPMPGVVEVSRKISVGTAVEELLILIGASFNDNEWDNQVIYIPF